VHLLNEVAQHTLGGVEVGNNPIFQGADRDDVARGTTDHLLGLSTDGQDATGVGVDRHHTGFVQDDAASTDVDQGICRTQVNSHFAADEGQIVGHTWGRLPVV